MARPPEKFRVRLKQLLGLKSNPNTGVSPQLPPTSEEGPVFSDELLKEIGKENSQQSRGRILKELCEVVGAKRLEENAVQVLWLAVQDLLTPEVLSDVRQITLQFLTSLVIGQFDTLKLLRAHFFRVIQNQNIPEDLHHRLLFLKALTADGKEIGYFEEHIGPFLLSWMPEVVSGEKLEIFLPLLRNIIRYHASYLDEEIVAGLVKQTCQMSNTTDKESDIENALAVLDAIIRYSFLPSSVLYSFVVAVCNTVNIEKFCEPSWKLMKHLLGTHLGHNTVLTMCYILEDSQNWKKYPLLRGAIFFVGMCLWGSKRVTSLKHKPIAVLPSFYKVLSCDNESVICEVALSMQRLVKKYGSFQHVVAWETILDITIALQEYVEAHPSCGSVSDNFHILVSYVEELYEKHQFNGSTDKLFAIVERCTSKRPESSVILLVTYRAQSLHPYHDNWFGNIKALMEKYFKHETRTQIRIKVLDALLSILKTFSHLYEEELLDSAVLPYLDGIAKDQDIAVRTRGVQLLVELIEVSDSQKVADVLNVIEKVAKCPVDPLKRYVEPFQNRPGPDQLQDEKGLEDIKEAILGLVRLFKVKLFRQAQSHAERIFNILVTHIKTHYDNGYRTLISAEIRLAILECLLSLRADRCHRLGIVQEGEIKFSSYFCCVERKCSSEEKAGCPTGLVAIPYSEAMNVILMCLQQEWEWQVLDIVLRSFPEALQDKNLILSGKQYLNSLCSVLCKMVPSYDFLSSLCSVPREISHLHLYERIFPVLTELSTYHDFIDEKQQFSLVRTMEIGLVDRQSAALCISSLTICTLEMSAVMTSLLPTFLKCFVKLSPTPQVALPLLELLSALSHLRELCTNFTNEQFESIFRICLPYTNSTRFSQYTVTLAHNVVASWFVHCPLHLRKQFVSFIVKNLKTPDLTPTSPIYLKPSGSPQKGRLSPGFPLNPSAESPVPEDGTTSLSEEMVEVMVDAMAKYTFSSSLTQPKRTPVVEQLLANGTSRSWLLGNVLVTVTVGNRIHSNQSCPFCSSVSTNTTDPNLPSFESKIETPEKLSDANKSMETDTSRQNDSISRQSDSISRQSDSISRQNNSISRQNDSISRQNDSISRQNDSSSRQNASILRETGTDQETPKNRKWLGDDMSPASTTCLRTPPIKDQGGVDTSNVGETSTMQDNDLQDSSTTAAWCGCVSQAWAEFLVRRPTGSTSWVLRLQNRPKHAGRSSQRLVDRKCPRVYESVIPKQFFDDLSAELQRELNTLTSHVSQFGVLSKSADSDTLVVDLLKPYIVEQQQQIELEGLKMNTGSDEYIEISKSETCVGDEQPLSGEGGDFGEGVGAGGTQGAAKGGDRDRVRFEDGDGGDGVDGGDDGDGGGGEDDGRNLSSSSLTALEISERVSLASSFMERTRLLSRSPMDGASAFMMLNPVPKLNSPLEEEVPEDFLAVKRTRQKFEKPIVGKSPLDAASPLKIRLCQEESSVGENFDSTESDLNISIDGEIVTRQDYTTSTPDIGEPTNNESASLPGSRTQSPLTATSRRHRLSESSGGSSSLPTSPLLSPRKRGAKQGENVDGRVTPIEGLSAGVNIPGRKGPREKSATVDIGMLRRISSSPDLNAPIKEKRGILKMFVGDNDKVQLRRQTASATQLGKFQSHKRRSYNGPFPDTAVASTSSEQRDSPVLNTTASSEHRENEDIDSSDTLSPNFIFLQFYYSSGFGPSDLPLAVPEEQFFHRAVKNLDRIPSYDTHKIGVIYVGRCQETDEVAILRNPYGSSRYTTFLSGLGELVRLRDCAQSEVYTGGLDRNGADGEYAYNWKSETTQVIFHAATLMPNKDKDPNCHSKKLHIGNDFVTIVYNDSEAKYNIGTIKGQFNFVEVVIKPLDNATNVVTLNIKEELKEILWNTNCGPRVISDQNLPTLVRHIAVHVNMASVIHQSQKTPRDAYGCNWLQRLRQLKRIRSRILSTGTQPAQEDLNGIRTTENDNIYDFTGYIL